MVQNLDKYLTQYFFNPLTKLYKIKNYKIEIPILMYHSISDKTETNNPYFWINTSRKYFIEQMKYLKINGYKVISLTEAVDLINKFKRKKTIIEKCYFCNNPNLKNIVMIKDSKIPREKYVVITFDDGFRDFYTTAYPILTEFNFTATVFLPTAFIGNSSLLFKNKQHLNWPEIIELHQKGISFGSHTVNHLTLHKLSPIQINLELKQSKEDIENKLGAPISSFSYPYAFPEDNKKFIYRLKKALSGYGYKYGVSTRIGRACEKDEIFFLKRIPINSRDNLAFFKIKLEGGYDWLHWVQLLSKIIRGKLTNGK